MMNGLTTGKLAQYSGALRTLDRQLVQLTIFNQLFWEGRLAQDQLESVAIATSHVQQMNHLELLHVDFGLPEETLRMWWRVVRKLHPTMFESDYFAGDHLLWDYAPNTSRYEPGIHRVHVDLIGNGQLDVGHTPAWHRQVAAAQGRLVAQAEALSAYAMHPELLQEQTPTICMAGYEATLVQDDESWTGVPYFSWGRLFNKVWSGIRWDQEGVLPPYINVPAVFR